MKELSKLKHTSISSWYMTLQLLSEKSKLMWHHYRRSCIWSDLASSACATFNSIKRSIVRFWDSTHCEVLTWEIDFKVRKYGTYTLGPEDAASDFYIEVIPLWINWGSRYLQLNRLSDIYEIIRDCHDFRIIIINFSRCLPW